MSSRNAARFSRRTEKFREEESLPPSHEVWEARAPAAGPERSEGSSRRTNRANEASRGAPSADEQQLVRVSPAFMVETRQGAGSPNARNPEGVRLSPRPLGVLRQDDSRHLGVPSTSACTVVVGWLGSSALRFDPSLLGPSRSGRSPKASLRHLPALRRSGVTRGDLGGPNGHWHPPPRSETPIRVCGRSRVPGDPSDPTLRGSPLAVPVSPKARRPGRSPGRSRSSDVGSYAIGLTCVNRFA